MSKKRAVKVLTIEMAPDNTMLTVSEVRDFLSYIANGWKGSVLDVGPGQKMNVYKVVVDQP